MNCESDFTLSRPKILALRFVIAASLITTVVDAVACEFRLDTVVGKYIPEGVLATDVSVDPRGLAWDGERLLVATSGRVRAIESSGTIHTLGGVGPFPWNVDDGVPAHQAELRASAIVALQNGDIVAAVPAADCIRVLRASTGRVETLAGIAGVRAVEWPPPSGVAANGVPLRDIYGVAVDAADRVLFCAGDAVWRIEASGELMRLAGGLPDPEGVGTGDGGLAIEATFGDPRGLAIDELGRILVSDVASHRIRLIDVDGTIRTIAGEAGVPGYSGDGGSALSSRLRQPYDLAVLSDGGIAINDRGNRVIRRIDSDGSIETIAGNGDEGDAQNGVDALDAPLSRFLSGVVEIDSGRIAFGDALSNRVRVLEPDGTLSIVAGNGSWSFGGDGGPAESAMIADPKGMALALDGSLLVTDGANGRVRRVGPGGSIETWAGNGTLASDGSGGDALDAAMQPFDIAQSPDGTVYIAEPYLVRAIGTDGVVRRVAGTGSRAQIYEDGIPALEAALFGPEGIGIGPAGEVYIVDENRVRVIEEDGLLRTICGTGVAAWSEDGGAAQFASLNSPQDVVVAVDGRILVAETGGNRIRAIETDGTIATFAGNGLVGNTGDGGPALDAAIGMPRALAIGADGSVYVSTWLGWLRRIDSQGSIETLAGTGESFFDGDGVCSRSATLVRPAGIVVAGNRILVADAGCSRVRVLIPEDEVSIEDEKSSELSPGPIGTSWVEIHPNPIRRRGVLRAALDTHGIVEVRIYDLRGRRVGEVIQALAVDGSVRATIDLAAPGLRRISPGTYLAVLRQGGRQVGASKFVVVE